MYVTMVMMVNVCDYGHDGQCFRPFSSRRIMDMAHVKCESIIIKIVFFSKETDIINTLPVC